MQSDGFPVFEIPQPWNEISQLGLEKIVRRLELPKNQPHSLLVHKKNDELFDISYFGRNSASATVEIGFQEENYLFGPSRRARVTVYPEKNDKTGDMTISLYPDRVHVHDFYVSPEIRNNGFGHVLLDASLAIAELTDRNRFSLKMKNEGDEGFLSHYGFRQADIDTKWCDEHQHESVIIGAETEEELNLPCRKYLSNQNPDSLVLTPECDKETRTPLHDNITGIGFDRIEVPLYRVYLVSNGG